ncbi:MAG: hypothetical protein ACK502_08695 [Alphaproteobacteria bacterium]
MQDNPDKYVDYALAQAQTYIDQYKNSPRLAGKTQEETSDIREFLESKPYDNEKVRAAVKDIITDSLSGKTAAEKGKKPDVIYLSGALGANNLLRGMAVKEGVEVGAELKTALDGSVQSDFAAYKAAVSTKLLDGGKIEPYAKYRPLLSGVDQAVQKAAEDMRLNQVVDNTMALADNEVQGGLAHLTKQAEGNNLRMYAVALTPEQSKAEAKKLGMDEKEAERTARDFRRSFPSLMSTVPNLTMVDKEGTVIYQQVDGKETRRDSLKMAAWAAGFKDGASQSEVVAPPAGLPPKKEDKRSAGM